MTQYECLTMGLLLASSLLVRRLELLVVWQAGALLQGLSHLPRLSYVWSCDGFYFLFSLQPRVLRSKFVLPFITKTYGKCIRYTDSRPELLFCTTVAWENSTATSTLQAVIYSFSNQPPSQYILLIKCNGMSCVIRVTNLEADHRHTLSSILLHWLLHYSWRMVGEWGNWRIDNFSF